MGCDLTGRVALVTGGAKSIGRGIAVELAKHGAAVVIADWDVANGQEATDAVIAMGGQARLVEMDLSIPGDCTFAVGQTIEAFGRLDILVNNAVTVGQLRPVLDLSPDEWQHVISTNLTGTFLVSQAAARHMVQQGTGGAIINLLAIQIFTPIPNYAAYCASKGGLLALTRSLAVELGDKGIRVNGIAVGSVYADSMARTLPGDLVADYLNDYETVPPVLDESAATLLGRMGRPSDIARVVRFLASDEAGFITGSVLTADGGRLLSRKADPLMTNLNRA